MKKKCIYKILKPVIKNTQEMYYVLIMKYEVLSINSIKLEFFLNTKSGYYTFFEQCCNT